MSSEIPNEITISFDIAGSVNYASWQNSVPLLRSLEVTNHASETLEDMRLICDSSPSFTRSKEWVISRLAPGESMTIRDRDVQLDPAYLNGLDEAEKGLIKLRLVRGETLIAEATHEIRMLARDEWGGMNGMAELLAAHVWQLVSQVGVSGFRVDLGVVHPERPGAYLAGVECDGATYHRSVAARDRDKTRQAVLEGLGWNIVRIWSPDWWYDSRGASERAHLALNDLLDQDRKRRQELEQAERARCELEDAAREAEAIAQATSASTADDEVNAAWDEEASGYERLSKKLAQPTK